MTRRCGSGSSTRAAHLTSGERDLLDVSVDGSPASNPWAILEPVR